MTPSRRFRIAIGALLFEGNTLSPVVTELQDFRNKYLEEGPALIPALRRSNTEAGGAIQVCELYPDQVEIVPLMATHGGAGGRVSAAAYGTLREMLLAPLRAAGPVDAVYLALHGSFIAEGTDDMEGDVLAEARAIVGPEVPIAVSCDLHGHITEKMMANVQILIGYRHYPHDDAFDTGRRCAGFLIRTLKGQIRPVTRVRKAPMIIPAQKQRTKSDGPMGQFHATARAREWAGEVLAASYFPVQPWLDFEGLGFAAVVVTDDDPQTADRVALEMAQEAWLRRHDFEVPTVDPGEAIAQGLAIEGGPVVLADAADCVGGGASGDSAVVLEALIRYAPDARSTILIVDPETAQEARAAGEGARFRARIGNKLDASFGSPVEAEVEVVRLFEGRFTYSGGLMGGVTADMGPSAVLRIGGCDVVIASYSSYEYADEQFRAAGIDPHSCKFVVVKNPMNYQQAYDGAPAMLVLTTPGPTTPNLRLPDWQKMSRPMYPLDDNFEPGYRAF